MTGRPRARHAQDAISVQAETAQLRWIALGLLWRLGAEQLGDAMLD